MSRGREHDKPPPTRKIIADRQAEKSNQVGQLLGLARLAAVSPKLNGS
jgi:hypothetical protein